MDMCFYWVRDRVYQNHFDVKLKTGHLNPGGSFTKHHPPMHYCRMQQTYLLNAIISLQELILQGCSKTRNLGSGQQGD